jgi:hypothetical protein
MIGRSRFVRDVCSACPPSPPPVAGAEQEQQLTASSQASADFDFGANSS